MDIVRYSIYAQRRDRRAVRANPEGVTTQWRSKGAHMASRFRLELDLVQVQLLRDVLRRPA